MTTDNQNQKARPRTISRWQKLKQAFAWFCTTSAEKQARLDKIIGRLAYFPAVMALYEDAKADGVTFKFSDGKDAEINGAYLKFFRNNKREITLNPFIDDEKLQYTLIHELRHYAQDKAMGFKAEVALHCPTTSLIYTRLIEADAFAYEHTQAILLNYDIKVIKAITQNTPRNTPPQDLNRHMALIQLAYEAKNPRPDEATLMKEYFLKYLKSLSSYDARNIRQYHLLKTHPSFLPITEQGVKITPLTLSEMREAIKLKLDEQRWIDYLAEMSNAELTKLIVGEIKPEILKTAKLIRAFEKAAARKPFGYWQSRKKRKAIHAQVKKL
jgi:hypothetical protein